MLQEPIDAGLIYEDELKVAEAFMNAELKDIPNTEEIASFYVRVLVGALYKINYNKDFELDINRSTFGFNEFQNTGADGFINTLTADIFAEDISIELNTNFGNESFLNVQPETFYKRAQKDIEFVGKELLKLKVDPTSTDVIEEYINSSMSLKDGLFNVLRFVNQTLALLQTTYQSAYQMDEPVGVIIPGSTLVGIENGKYVEPISFSTSIQALAQSTEVLTNKDIEVDMKNRNIDVERVYKLRNTPRRLFVPKKQLEYLFGTELKSEAMINDLYGQRKYTTWNKAEKAIKEDLKHTFKRAFRYFLTQEAPYIRLDENLAEQFKEHRSKMVELNRSSGVYFEAIAKSLSTTFIINKLTGSWDLPGEISIIATLSEKTLDSVKSTDVLSTTLFNQFSKEASISLGTTEEIASYKEPEALAANPIFELKPILMRHVFNEKVANAMPRFAIEALRYVKNQLNQEVTWQNLLVGMDVKGRLITGQNQVRYSSNVLHWLQAQSRAGKGVQSFNIILSALSENKLFFYADRKPDTSKILMEQSNNQLLVVNGNMKSDLNGFKGFDRQYTLQKQLRPNWFNKEVSDDTYSDYIYLRMIVVSLATALLHYEVQGGFQTVAKAIGYTGEVPTGTFIVWDEFTNFYKSFLTSLNPARTGSFLNGAATTEAIQTIKDYEEALAESEAAKAAGKAGKLSKEIKTQGSQLNLDSIYKYMIATSMNTFNTKLFELNKAGLDNDPTSLDLLIIGQGMPFQRTGSVSTGFMYKEDGLQWKNTNNQAREVLTDALLGLTKTDFVLGSPGATENMIDFLNVNKGSKASQYLNQNYRGFAYLTRDQLTFDKDLGFKGSPENAFFFKPFLILNDLVETQGLSQAITKGEIEEQVKKTKGTPATYLAQMAKSIAEAGIDWQEARKTIITQTGGNADVKNELEPAIGFIKYANELTDASELAKRYAITPSFMDKLVHSLGYEGSAQDFIYDTRPEWFISIQDFAEAFQSQDIKTAFYERKTLEPLRKYLSSSTGAKDKRHIDLSVIGELTYENETEDEEIEIQSYPSFTSEPTPEPQFIHEEPKSPQPTSSPKATLFEKLSQQNKNHTPHNGSITHSPFHENINANLDSARQEKIREKTGNAYTPEGLKVYNSDDYVFGPESKVYARKYFETDCPHAYEDPDVSNLDLFDQTEAQVATFMDAVTAAISTQLGLTVTKHIYVGADGQLFIYQFEELYEVLLHFKEEEVQKLPPAIREVAKNQQWGRLMNWSIIKRFKHLRELTFESNQFVADYVSESFTKEGYITDASTILRQIKNLNKVTIANNTTTREEMKPEGFWTNFKPFAEGVLPEERRTYMLHKFKKYSRMTNRFVSDASKAAKAEISKRKQAKAIIKKKQETSKQPKDMLKSSRFRKFYDYVFKDLDQRGEGMSFVLHKKPDWQKY